LEVQNKVETIELFAPHRVILLDNELMLVKSDKKKQDLVKCCLMNDSVLIWEETEKSLVNWKQGKVHLFEEIVNIVLKEDDTEDTIILVFKKNEFVLVFTPQSKIKKSDWIIRFKEAIGNLSHSKETLKIQEDEQKVVSTTVTTTVITTKKDEKEKNIPTKTSAPEISPLKKEKSNMPTKSSAPEISPLKKEKGNMPTKSSAQEVTPVRSVGKEKKRVRCTTSKKSGRPNKFNF